MKLAVNLSMIFTEVPLIERFAQAKRFGFDHVEIQFPYELSIHEIQTQLNLHQLSLCLINVPAGDLMQGGNGIACIPGKEQDFKAAIAVAIEYATALNVPRINILAGKKPSHIERNQCLDTFIQNLKFACAELKPQQIEPVFEMINGDDMPEFLIQNIMQAKHLLESVNCENLKMQFDCYHMAKMGENVLDALHENIDQIGHIQFADVPGRHQPETGDLDYSSIFKWLKNSRYSGYVAAEYRPSPSSEQSFAWKNNLI